MEMKGWCGKIEEGKTDSEIRENNTQAEDGFIVEYDEEEIKTRWLNHLEIGGESFIPHSVQCVVESAD